MKVTPSLSDKGWVKDSATRLRTMFLHMLACKPEQVTLHKDRYVSLQEIFGNYGSNPLELETQLQQQLYVYFNQTFESAVVEVDIPDIESPVYTVNLYIQVTDENGETHNMAKVLQRTENGAIKEIIKGR